MTSQAIATFHASIYQDHMEEASFLYEQTVMLRQDPLLTWSEVEDYEGRLAAHLDALALGETNANQACLASFSLDDSGSVYVALATACHTDDWDVLQELLVQIDGRDADVMRAAGDALNQSMRTKWLPQLQSLAETHEPLLPLVIRWIGWRRVKHALPWLSQWSENPHALASLIWSLGRLNRLNGNLLEKGFALGDPALSAESALAAARSGQQPLASHLRNWAREDGWPLLPMGLCGSAKEALSLIRQARREGFPSTDGLLCLGLLGHSTAVEILLSYLDIPQAAGGAAEALELLTGAGLLEEVTLHFDDEDGEPPREETTTRLTHDRQKWQQWWDSHRHNFDESLRYRLGEPALPDSVIKTLQHPYFSMRTRFWACHELSVRFSMPFSLEIDMTVRDQKVTLSDTSRVISSAKNAINAGTWYYRNQPIPL